MLNQYTTHELRILLQCVLMAKIEEKDKRTKEEIEAWEGRIKHALSNAMFEENGTN